MTEHWPRTLWIARHGQSAGNVARDAAEAAGHPLIDLEHRDIDVPLSPLGVEQSRALGRWFGTLSPEQGPQVLLCSPYIRARETARLLLDEARLRPGEHLRLRVDERLREKEFGILDRLTKHGIQQKYPELNEQRTHVGKFYFRPPGGESWCDVILRLRSVLDSISLHHSEAGDRVLIVAHQVIVLCLRYLIETMTESEILEIDRQAEVANCGVTESRLDRDASPGGMLRLAAYNFVAPLEEAGAPVTSRPDTPAGAK
jgi:broad specificity phosphatase PhoE